MKKIFNFTKKKKFPSNTPDNGSVLSVGYELKEKDLGKVHKAASVGDVAKLKQLAKKNDINQLDKENRTALHIACASGHVEVVQFLVESKAKLNLCDNQNRSALMKAVQGQYERCVSVLLENHAEPNLVDINGNTALHLAANIPATSTAMLLLEHEADINSQNKEGFTPLAVAVRENHLEMAEFLLKEGTDVNVKDQGQRSPLMIAAGSGQIGMLRLLLQFDADITLKDTNGWSSDDHAVINGHHACSHLIIEHGTKRNAMPSPSHQVSGKKKKKILLGSPSLEVEAGFSLGGPATDKDDAEDNSQSESLSRASKSAAADWPSSEDDDESDLIPKKPQKVNLRKLIASKKGEDADSEAELGKNEPSEQPSSSRGRSDSPEGSPEPEDSEEEDDEDDDDEDDDGEDEDDDEDDDNDDEDEDEESEEEDEGDNEDDEEEQECEEEDDDAVASVSAKALVNASGTDDLKIIGSGNAQNEPESDNKVSGSSLVGIAENVHAPENATNPETQNNEIRSARTSNYGIPVTLGVEDDCVVSAIRVESKLSDEDESLGKESIWSSDQNIKSNLGSTSGPVTPRHSTGTHSLNKVEEENFGKEKEIDDDDDDDDLDSDSWSDKPHNGDTMWNDSDDNDEGNQKGGFGRNTVLAKLSNMVPEDEGDENSDNPFDAKEDYDNGSNKETSKVGKRRSSWGSSLEDNDSDNRASPREDDRVDKDTPDQKSDAQVSDLLPEATTLPSKSTSPKTTKDNLESSLDSSSPMIPRSKRISPKPKVDEPKSSLELSSPSTRLSRNRSAKAKVDESKSEWDSFSDNYDHKDGASSTKGEVLEVIGSEEIEVLSPFTSAKASSTNQAGEQPCSDDSWEDEDEENGKESNVHASPAVSPEPEHDKTINIQILDNDGVESIAPEIEGKVDHQKDYDDGSWDDDEDEGDEPEKLLFTIQHKAESSPHKCRPTAVPPVQKTSPLSRPTSAMDKELDEETDEVDLSDDDEKVPVSVIDESAEDNSQEEKKKDPINEEKSADSDSREQKLQYNFATIKVSNVGDDSNNTLDGCLCEGDKSDDEYEPRLTAYITLCDKDVIVPQTIISLDDIDEEPVKEVKLSSTPTKDDVAAGQHYGSKSDEFSDEELPQTDIDDVDIDSPVELESVGKGSPDLRKFEELVNQKEDSTQEDDDDKEEEDEDDYEDEEEEEEEEEEGDHTDENDQNEEDDEDSPVATTLVQEREVSKDKQRDFLSELGLEKGEEEQDSWDSESHSENPNKTHNGDRSSRVKDQEEMSVIEEENKEVVRNNNDGNGDRNDSNGKDVDNSGDVPLKETEKAKWEPLSVLSKLEGETDRKTDLMEELGLGDVDDLEDASDWDSASTTSRRTLPGRRMASSPGVEELPECSTPSVQEQEQEISAAAPPTPQKSVNLEKRMSTLPSPPALTSHSAPQSLPHPQPRTRKMVPQKPESEEESDWDSDNVTSSSSPVKTDNQLANIAEHQTVVRPGSSLHEPSVMAGDCESNLEAEQQRQKVGKERTETTMEVQKPSASWDAGGPQEGVEVEKPETSLGWRKELSRRNGATEREQQLTATDSITQRLGSRSPKSTNRGLVQLHLPLQQNYNNNKQEGQAVAVEGTSQLELVRGARHSRAPQTNTHVNGDPLSVFDDSTLSEVSDDEGRSPSAAQRRDENPGEMEMEEDFDELTQSSDTATDDIDSPTSGYRHASLLIQKLDSATLDSRSMVKLQSIFHEYERTIQKARSRHGHLSDKVSQMEMERAELKNSLEEIKDVKSALERHQLELQTEVNNLKFQLKQEQENRRNATMMYNNTREKLKRTEEQQQLGVEQRQRVELTLRNLELEMRTLVNNMKQLEEDHSETQRLLAQERSARTLQENLFNNHLRKQQEIEEENRRNVSKSNEALSQLTETSDREKELLQQTATLQEELSILRIELERSRANSSLEESRLAEESEALKECLEDARRDLKLNKEALTQTAFQYNSQLTTLKSELAVTTTHLEHERQTREMLEAEVDSTRNRLAGALQEAERCQAARADTEKALLREKEEHQHIKDKHTGEAAKQREAVSSLSQKLTKAEAHVNSMENEVHRATLQLTEKALLLEALQREKDQAAARVKELETALQAEKELAGRAGARQEATQERLAQTQSEGMLLRQQLEEAQNKGVAKDHAVTDAQERFSDILSKLRSDCEERVQLVEERSKELATKAADLRDQVYKLEEEKHEREAGLRQLQQELADSLKKLSMSEASLEVNTRYRNDLEEEKGRLFKDIERLKGKLEESEDQYVQAERRINSLKSSVDERERELTTAAQKLQEALSASAGSDITMKQLEEAVQRLEIENARLEAAAKQQSNKIDALQKGAQEAAMVRSRLEDLVTNLQGSKMTLEDQLNREVQKQSMLSHTAQDSQALWEEELKSRSKLGLRLAELEKEKGELNTQMEIERKKAKKISEQKKAVDTRLDQEMKRNTELQKEMYRLRTLLKTAKKKLQDTGGAEFGSPMSSLRMEMGRPSQAEGAIGRMKEKVDDLQVQLEKEASRCSQLEKVNGELKEQLASQKSLSRSSERLERSKRQLEEEVSGLRRQMEAGLMDQSQAEQYRRNAEERARQEIRQKLEEVNLFLQTQAASQEALDQIKSANESNLRSHLEQKIRELEGELGRARSTQHDSLNQRDSTRTELDRYRKLYTEELRLRKSLAAKLERANNRLSEANAKLLNEHHRSKSFIASSIINGSLGGPSLDVGSLGSAATYGATLGPLNRSLGIGLPLLSPMTEGQNSRVEDYLAKMQSELDRNISKELVHATAELEGGSARMSPVGSASGVDLDPVSRATQQYLEVLKKNYMI